MRKLLILVPLTLNLLYINSVDAEGLMYIEAVKGVGDIYYVLEKGGYILSIFAKEGKLVSEDNTEVLIKEFIGCMAAF